MVIGLRKVDQTVIILVKTGCVNLKTVIFLVIIEEFLK